MIDLKMNNIVLHFSVKHVCIEGKELMSTKLTCSVCKDIPSHSQVMCAIPMQLFCTASNKGLGRRLYHSYMCIQNSSQIDALNY